MKSTAKKKLFINNMITLGMVVAAWIIMEVLMGTGHVSSLLKGLLVPFCIYVIMAVSSTETVMHVSIASAGIFVACMFPIHQFLYLFSTSHGLFSIPLRHTQNLSLPKTSSGKCSNRTGCSLPS